MLQDAGDKRERVLLGNLGRGSKEAGHRRVLHAPESRARIWSRADRRHPQNILVREVTTKWGSNRLGREGGMTGSLVTLSK